MLVICVILFYIFLFSYLCTPLHVFVAKPELSSSESENEAAQPEEKRNQGTIASKDGNIE